MGLLLFLCACCLCNTAAALSFSHVDNEGAAYTVIRVDPRHDKLQLFPASPGDNKVAPGFAAVVDQARAHKQTLRFAMNAGMFEADLSSVGLLVANGVQVSALNSSQGYGNFYLKPNGVFLLDRGGAHIVESSEYSGMHEGITLATQSGPLLLRHGIEHPAFHATSNSRLTRNGVGIDAQGMLVFVISDSAVNFHQFAMLFRDVLHCDDALYLDGTVSSLYAPELGRNDAKVRLGPVIGVVD
jgi:uncharacterized protein YigE (DUF2233 family)